MSRKNKTSSYRENLLVRSEEARTVRKIVLIILASLILIFIVGGLSAYLYINAALGPVNKNDDTPIKVMIPLGSSTSSIASILEENEVIKDSRVFRFYTKIKNKSDFQAGDYTFTKSLSLNEITDMLKTGKLVAEPFYTVTIPEGKSIDEIAEIYAEVLPITKEDFLEKINDREYIKELIAAYPEILSEKILAEDIRSPLEGYLFAATYSYYEEDPTIESIVEEMIEITISVINPYLEEMVARDLTVHEALTFASLVENEARSEEQRRKIAGVFYNRLEKDMKLQTDPTVLYALGEHKDQVLYKDLEVESPFNTYYISGLPIGPISNFSKISLEATLFPEESENEYFLHDENGNMHYAETFEEHVRLKEKYIK